MKIQNNFLKATVNKDLDERLTPNGQLVDSQNFMVKSEDDSGAGVGKNVLGNTQKTDLGIVGGETIGSVADGSRDRVFYFVKGDEFDYVMVWYLSGESKILLQSTSSTGVLNFSKEYRISHSDVFESDEDSYLLAWTDGLNPPRVINIDREYEIDGFTEEEISVIKAPPRVDLQATPIQSTNNQESNFIEDKFVSFAYRYKFKDGFFSAISSWTAPQFIPNSFSINPQTGYNDGMINSANAVNLIFDTGSREVVEVDLLFKETNSSIVYVIDKFKKEDEGWGDYFPASFEFNNSKIYLPLPESQYFRNFDNVPLVANAQSKIGNRIAYGNYEEGRDIDTAIDFEVDVVSSDSSGSSFDTDIVDGNLTTSISNKINWSDEVEFIEGNTNTFMDVANDNFSMVMAANSTLKFTTNIDLTSDDCTYALFYNNINDSILLFPERSSDEVFEYVKVNDTGADLQIDFNAFVSNILGEVLYDAELTVEYKINDVTDFKVKYTGDFNQSYGSQSSSSTQYNGNIMPKGAMIIDFQDHTFEKDSFIFIDFTSKSTLYENNQTINGTMFYQLEDDYSGVSDFYNNSGFKNYIETTYSGFFEQEYTVSGVIESFTSFSCDLIGNDIKISMPVTRYVGDYSDVELYRLSFAEANFSVGGAFTSMHSNRDYEVCQIYLDKQGRKTTALTCKTNTIYIPNNKSTSQNKLKVTLNHNPPSWADRYKFAVKQVRGSYETIFSSIFYRDGVYVWFKVTGTNRLDLKEGDELIVKRDSTGVLTNKTIKTTILEVKTQEKNFIEGNLNDVGAEIIEDSGTYIKVFPDGFNVEYNEGEFLDMQDDDSTLSDRAFGECGVGEWIKDDEDNPIAVGVPYTYPGGYGTSLYRAKILKGFSSFNESTQEVEDVGFPLGSTLKITLWCRNDDDYGNFEKTYVAQSNYESIKEFFDSQIVNEVPFPTQEGGLYETVQLVKGFAYYREDDSKTMPTEKGYFRENENGYYFLKVESIFSAHGSTSSYISVKVNVRFTNDLLCFETEPIESIESPFYETPGTYNVIDGQHEFTEHILNDTFNCFSFGNGVESHQIQDKFNEKYVSLNAIPTAVSEDDYRKINRFADLTYSGVYQPSTNVNSLNEFNLSQANYKDDIEKRYGKIIKLYSTETDLLVIQEDKWSKVLYGKDLLFNADTTTNLSRISDVLGQQVMYGGEYGISQHPESFDEYSFNNYSTDVNRGVVMRKNNSNGLMEISNYGMTDYFKKLFRDNNIINIIGAYDAFYDVYFLNIKYGSTKTPEYVTWVFSDSDKGFLTRATFNPEDMVRLNNEFVSFKNGDIYLHNNGLYNTYYGMQEPSKFSFNFSQEPSTRKLFRNISIEGTDSWDIDLKTDLQEGFINKVNFSKKEGVWYGYVRGEENEVDLATLSVQGIGQISEIVGDTISFVTDVPSIISVGDVVYNTSMVGIGNIVNKTSNSITLNSVVGLSVSDFILSTKPQSVETSGLLGYYMRVDAELTSDEYSEVFAVNSEVSKSFE